MFYTSIGDGLSVEYGSRADVDCIGCDATDVKEGKSDLMLLKSMNV